MTALRAILDGINDLETTISKIEGSQEGVPSRAVQLTLLSLYTRRDELQTQLNEISKREQVDVCDYRIVPEGPHAFAISSVAGALSSLQDLVSLVFDALQGRPKERATISVETMQKTQFDFGYAYSGSLGLVLTIPNQRLLAINSHLDNTVSAVFQLIRIRNSASVRVAAQQYGIPVVRKLNEWARLHASNGMSFELKWIRDNIVRDSVVAESSDMAALTDLIVARQETVTETIDVEGELVAWNVRRRTFGIEVEGTEPVTGNWSAQFDRTLERTLPRRYRANVTKHSVRAYVDDEKVTWTLNSLQEMT